MALFALFTSPPILQGALSSSLRTASQSPTLADTTARPSAHALTGSPPVCSSAWKAGVREYWLVDARKELLQFDILRHTSRGYVATRKRDGWMKSAVFGKSFRLTQQPNGMGHPDYTLAVR